MECGQNIQFLTFVRENEFDFPLLVLTFASYVVVYILHNRRSTFNISYNQIFYLLAARLWL